MHSAYQKPKYYRANKFRSTVHKVASTAVEIENENTKTKSRCYPDVISFHPDDSGNESILGAKQGKDGFVCKDSPVTTCNGLSPYISISGVASQQKDAPDLSALVPVQFQALLAPLVA